MRPYEHIPTEELVAQYKELEKHMMALAEGARDAANAGAGDQANLHMERQRALLAERGAIGQELKVFRGVTDF